MLIANINKIKNRIYNNNKVYKNKIIKKKL